ncbi:MAG: hypothetical protein HYR56_18240 [Acidobacteria bacterium]|nr:hypothetical protein [Acidobacteriota bacterium]MBI3425814.1 hypothetical protein [Acidobacteriota bacterium]
MSDSTLRLPAHPSLEQLRKQAKELLKDYRADALATERICASNPRLAASTPTANLLTLAYAQFVLAREYGFESWAKLVRHVETINPTEYQARYEKLAQDIVATYHGDAAAQQRLDEQLPGKATIERFQGMVQQRMRALLGVAEWNGEFTLADAQLILARQHGFEDWAGFLESFAQPPSDLRAAPIGRSSTPPFYKIDWERHAIEPGPTMSSQDWDTLFAVMEEQQLTSLNANGLLTDAALAQLAQLDFVTNLNFGGTKRITDDGLRHLARMPQLQEIDLSEYPGGQITDRGLECLRHLPELRRFQMCWQSGISDAGVANLAFCDQLESVDLLGTHTGDGAIRVLTGKRNLRRFKTGRLVTDAGIPLLHQLPVFKTWQGGQMKYELMSPDAEPNHLLLDGPFTDKGFASIAGLDGLFGLTFFWHVSALTAAGLKPLADLPKLGFLGCQDALCSDEAMRHIAAIPQLRMLMGQGTVASDDGFTALSRSQTIEYIWGRECPNLGSRGFTALAEMPALKGLAVSCKNVDDAALSTLPRFPALRGLMPMDVTDAGFRHVGRCEQLENLWCMYCHDTGDAATEHLTGLSKLKTYYAGKTKITDRSLELLGRMHSLETLEFWECGGISNAGLAYLASMPHLREITVGGSPNVTRAGMGVFPTTVRANYW